ncbi:DNA-3-methyladenine glycosylase [Megasphaera sp.]|uniref:DNA-3-methyladenine glycosylase n=1 Tax=Megasphaera sp. TaxID=2023260 RepID=UPI003F054ACE
MIGRRWRADEFCVDASLLAPRLLGQYVIHETPQGICSGRIVETEAYGGSYDGFPDDGAHSFRGLTKRTAPMFHAGGISYVYLIYGMYCCFNVVAGPEGEGQAVLIRAIEPICGTDLMAARRKARKAGRNLTNGPGKLCQAMAITREENALDLTSSCLYIAHPEEEVPFTVAVSPRIHIDYAVHGKHFPWRFYIQDNPYVSKV